MKKAKELGLEFVIRDGVFYNPHMRLSREISVGVIKALEEKLVGLDAFSASGIRGILYLKKAGVERIDFLDISGEAERNINENLHLHGINANVFRAEFNSFIWDKQDYNFIEIDPFGSPSPYIYAAIRSLRRKKTSYLSLTATDTAVLCGVHKKACVKAYGSIPLRSYFCHETGLRILIKKVVEVAAGFDLAFRPLVSFYYRHQMKVIGKLERSAEKAYRAMEELGYVFYDGKHIRSSKEPSKEKGEAYAGRLWLGKLHYESIVEKASNHVESKEAKKMLRLFKEENEFPPYYYDIHELARINKVNAVKTDEFVEKGKRAGMEIAKTHFSPTGVKARATFEELSKLLKRLSKG